MRKEGEGAEEVGLGLTQLLSPSILRANPDGDRRETTGNLTTCWLHGLPSWNSVITAGCN